MACVMSEGGERVGRKKRGNTFSRNGLTRIADFREDVAVLLCDGGVDFSLHWGGRRNRNGSNEIKMYFWSSLRLQVFLVVVTPL